MSHSTIISIDNINLDLSSFNLRFSACQVARNLGKTLREFQPTIRELQVGLCDCDICRSLFVSFILQACFGFSWRSCLLHEGCFKGIQEHT